jgi:hypothetical protein
MTIQLASEMERARLALASRPAAELADFILSLAFASDGISAYVHAFAIATDPGAAADVLRTELRFLQHGEQDSDYRYRKGAGHVARADRLLDAIERCFLPRDPNTGLRLLTAFLESQEQISQHCWDDDWETSQVFERARKMAERLAPAQ